MLLHTLANIEHAHTCLFCMIRALCTVHRRGSVLLQLCCSSAALAMLPVSLALALQKASMCVSLLMAWHVHERPPLP